MLPRSLYLIVVLVLALLLPAASRSETITPTIRAEDPRLSTLVTLNEPRVALSELLAKLSEQTGVALQTNPLDPASGRQIFLCCDHKPLGEVMDALWSLLSYQPGVWKWERTGKASAFRYAFAPTLGATNLPQTLKDMSQQVFMDYAKAMLVFAAMPPEERRRNVAKITAALMQPDDKMALQMLEQDGFTWNCLRAFMQALTPQQQQNVLRGNRVPVTLDKMPDDARTAFHQAWSWSNPRHTLPDGQIVPYPEPSIIFFETSGGHMGRRGLLPCLYIDMGNVGSLSVLGPNMERGYKDRIRSLWMLPGDARENELLQQICVSPKTPDVDVPSQPRNDEELRAAGKQGRVFSAATTPAITQIRFGQLSRALPVMVVALLPDPSVGYYDPDAPYGKTVEAFLQKAITSQVLLMTKWRGNALLVSDPTWFLYEDDSVPYAVVQQLQRAAKNGFVSFPVLAEVAAKVTADQWRGLCHSEPLQRMEAAYSLLQFCRVYPLMLKSDGLGLNEDVIQTLRRVSPLNNFPMLLDGKTRALRVLPVTRKGEKTAMYEMQVQYQNAQREWHPLVGFTQQRAVKPEPQ